MGTIFPAQRMSPQPAATLVMYESWFSEMCRRFASSSRSVADWFKRIKNSEFASMRRAVSERRSSSTFCVKPCHQPVVFADALPELVEEIGAVLIAEQQVKLVREYPCGLAFLPVLNDAVEDGVEGDQHPDGHELLAQFPDVIGDDSRLGIHVGALGKGVEAAGDEQFRTRAPALWLPAPAVLTGSGTGLSGWAVRPRSCWPCIPGTHRRYSGQGWIFLLRSRCPRPPAARTGRG